MSEELPKERNVLGGPLLACSYDPVTGLGSQRVLLPARWGKVGMGVKTLRVMIILTPTLRPRRAEQVPSALCLDATPKRDAAPQWSACLRAPSRSHPRKPGPLLHVSAHLPRQKGEGIGPCDTVRLSDAQ